ncbi:hypothetical protein [Actinoplanes sp. CA-252034]|uniref:hypothetical protein n=1 Tax=Actinoplanes sp. CA-252034 TaxID=3239906 RepID=UPI003D983954
MSTTEVMKGNFTPASARGHDETPVRHRRPPVVTAPPDPSADGDRRGQETGEEPQNSSDYRTLVVTISAAERCVERHGDPVFIGD